MTIKEIVVQNFLNGERNFTMFQTDEAEVSGLYDLMIESFKKKQDWDEFLVEQKAQVKIPERKDFAIRLDRIVQYQEKGSRETSDRKISFKYPVFNFLKADYGKVLEAIKKKAMPNEQN